VVCGDSLRRGVYAGVGVGGRVGVAHVMLESPRVAVDELGVDEDVSPGGVAQVGAETGDGAEFLVLVVDVGVLPGAHLAAWHVAEDVFEQDGFGDPAGHIR
jgi:hypothetical protein